MSLRRIAMLNVMRLKIYMALSSAFKMIRCCVCKTHDKKKLSGFLLVGMCEVRM